MIKMQILSLLVITILSFSPTKPLQTPIFNFFSLFQEKSEFKLNQSRLL